MHAQMMSASNAIFEPKICGWGLPLTPLGSSLQHSSRPLTGLIERRFVWNPSL